MKVGLELIDSVLGDAAALSDARSFLLATGFDEAVTNAILSGQEVHLSVTSSQLSRCIGAKGMVIHFPQHRSEDQEELYQCILRRAHPMAKAMGFQVEEGGHIALDPALGGAWVSGRFFVKFPLPT